MFGVNQGPEAAPRGFGAGARIMLCQTAIQIQRPADIGAIAAGRGTAQNIDKAGGCGVFCAMVLPPFLPLRG